MVKPMVEVCDGKAFATVEVCDRRNMKPVVGDFPTQRAVGGHVGREHSLSAPCERAAVETL